MSLLVLLLAGAQQGHADRRIDLTIAAFSALPERFGACIAGQLARPIELDLCGFGDVGVLTGTTHVFMRKVWRFSSSRVELGLGGGLGARVTRFCPFSVCAFGAGPEALLSLEGVKWLGDTIGVTLQVDAGLSLLWVSTGVDAMLRFPVRAMAGVSFAF